MDYILTIWITQKVPILSKEGSQHRSLGNYSSGQAEVDLKIEHAKA